MYDARWLPMLELGSSLIWYSSPDGGWKRMSELDTAPHEVKLTTGKETSPVTVTISDLISD